MWQAELEGFGKGTGVGGAGAIDVLLVDFLDAVGLLFGNQLGDHQVQVGSLVVITHIGLVVVAPIGLVERESDWCLC